MFIDTNVKDQDLRFGKYNQDLYRECEWCCHLFEIKKAFKENKFMCNEYYELLQMEDVRETISPKIYTFWTENQQYRVCTNIYRSLAESIFREKMWKVEKEKYQEKLLVFI